MPRPSHCTGFGRSKKTLFEHGNERSGNIKFWEFVKQLSDLRFLKNDSAP
jgi:hypothetical protein